MTEILEQRIKDIEELVFDIPHLLEARLNVVTVSYQEMAATLSSLPRQMSAANEAASARINMLERQMAQMLREMRDLRGGVTAQMAIHGRSVEALEQRVGALEQRFGALEQRFGALEQRFGALEGTVGELKESIVTLDTKFDTLITTVREALSHLPRA